MNELLEEIQSNLAVIDESFLLKKKRIMKYLSAMTSLFSSSVLLQAPDEIEQYTDPSNTWLTRFSVKQAGSKWNITFLAWGSWLKLDQDSETIRQDTYDALKIKEFIDWSMNNQKTIVDRLYKRYDEVISTGMIEDEDGLSRFKSLWNVNIANKIKNTEVFIDTSTLAFNNKKYPKTMLGIFFRDDPDEQLDELMGLGYTPNKSTGFKYRTSVYYS